MVLAPCACRKTEQDTQKRMCLKRYSQATLGTSVDDNAPGWTESVHNSLLGLATVAVPAGTVAKVRNCVPVLLRAVVLRTFVPETVRAHSAARASSPLCVDAECDCGWTVLHVWSTCYLWRLSASSGGCLVGGVSWNAEARHLHNKSIG